jgi:hypothetical protein
MLNKSLIFVSVIFLAVVLSACSASTANPIIQPTTNTPKYNLLGTQGLYYFVVIDKGLDSDRSALKNISDEICKGKTICSVLFWDDKSKAASSIPMTDAQVNEKIAQYNLNKNTSLDRLLVCASDGC